MLPRAFPGPPRRGVLRLPGPQIRRFAAAHLWWPGSEGSQNKTLGSSEAVVVIGCERVFLE